MVNAAWIILQVAAATCPVDENAMFYSMKSANSAWIAQLSRIKTL